MSRSHPLPLCAEWSDPDQYVDALLSFATSSDLFRNLCGGVHILDFLTREPDLYSTLLPEDWRQFFDQHDIHDILHLLLREDIEPLRAQCHEARAAQPAVVARDVDDSDGRKQYNGRSFPPASLLDYIHDIRRLSLRRDFATTPAAETGQTGSGSRKMIPRRVAVGMNVKKRHEVEHFAHYVDSLCTQVADKRRGREVSHVVDFGSGQNYLGRTLASSYNRNVVAIERRQQNITGANRMDIHAKLLKKNKKDRAKVEEDQAAMAAEEKRCQSCPSCASSSSSSCSLPPLPPAAAAAASFSTSTTVIDTSEGLPGDGRATSAAEDPEKSNKSVTVIEVFGDIDLAPEELRVSSSQNHAHAKPAAENTERMSPKGSMSYIEHDIQDGCLEPLIKHVVEPPAAAAAATDDTAMPNHNGVMVVSLHSCGNLVHHGIRSLVLNPSVVAVAMIGCCYNLMTERLGPTTWKLPILRSLHPRLTATSTAYDPHGFPMSQRFETFPHDSGVGVKLNITARMMAVQAPYNWGREDSEAFFKRHYYRALLQRLLVDKYVVPTPTLYPAVPSDLHAPPGLPQSQSGGTPLIVGSLRKSAFTSFAAYVRAAAAKLGRDSQLGATVRQTLAAVSDEELDGYVRRYRPAKKALSVTWSLMAFSAAVVEAVIVVDRWQFLREQGCVTECWVEPVFAYSESPRNLAVVGIKE